MKISLLFRGRDNEHGELGYSLFTRLIKDCADVGAPESGPRLFGHNLIMLLHPQHLAKSGGASAAPAKPPAPAPRPMPAPDLRASTQTGNN